MHEFGARLATLPADTVASLGFFSRLPVRAGDRLDLSRGAGAWPLAGLLLALLPAGLLLGLQVLGVAPLAAAAAALAAAALLTGGLHEDGLADTADGFGGGRSRDAKLTIMRDSRLGSFGGLALILALLIKAGALASPSLAPSLAPLALVGAAILSRSLALWHWRATPPARSDGLAVAAGQPDGAALALGSGIGAAGAILLLFAFGPPAMLALLLAAAAIWLFSRLCRSQIGGHTGDTIGAAQQIAETLLLLGLSAGNGAFR